ncbi:hypothetical protein DBV39_00790 [Orrella marina]|uniref:Uncharacterized protein n=2 Tax=Orrella marina TaxID=2163011 RepID=A0A2R4XFK5_9BURK|nr:hypothetical protein DBV39_00790 [Orrella marina]
MEALGVLDEPEMVAPLAPPADVPPASADPDTARASKALDAALINCVLRADMILSELALI